ncbi:MAG: hypothetical protein ABSE95_10585 [Thermodesulfobacteriota bacterium]
MLKKVLPASVEAFYIGRHPAPDWEPFQKLDDRFPTGNLFKARQSRADRADRPATRRPKSYGIRMDASSGARQSRVGGMSRT